MLKIKLICKSNLREQIMFSHLELKEYSFKLILRLSMTNLDFKINK